MCVSLNGSLIRNYSLSKRLKVNCLVKNNLKLKEHDASVSHPVALFEHLHKYLPLLETEFGLYLLDGHTNPMECLCDRQVFRLIK